MTNDSTAKPAVAAPSSSTTPFLIGAFIVLGAVLAGNHVVQQNAMADLRKQLLDTQQVLNVMGLKNQIAEEDAAALRAELATTKKDATDFRTEVEKLEKTLEAVKMKVADSHKMSRAKVMEVLNNFSGMDLRALTCRILTFQGRRFTGQSSLVPR